MLKTQPELDELVKYVRRALGGRRTLSDAWNWLNVNIPNWMQVHDTKITYEDQIGTDK